MVQWTIQARDHTHSFVGECFTRLHYNSWAWGDGKKYTTKKTIEDGEVSKLPYPVGVYRSIICMWLVVSK